MRGWRLEIGLVCAMRRSKSSHVGPQISHNGHSIAGTEFESEGAGHRHELPPTEGVHALKMLPAKFDVKLAGPS